MQVRWKKSRRSNSGSTCVEIAHTKTAIRDSKNPDGPVLEVTEQGLNALFTAVKAGLLS
jgi:hypothetical protein